VHRDGRETGIGQEERQIYEERHDIAAHAYRWAYGCITRSGPGGEGWAGAYRPHHFERFSVLCLLLRIPSVHVCESVCVCVCECMCVYMCVCARESGQLFLCIASSCVFPLRRRLSVCRSVCLSVGRSVCLSICLSVCLSVNLSVCLSIGLSVCLSVCLSDCNVFQHVAVYLFKQQSDRADCVLQCVAVCYSVFERRIDKERAHESKSVRHAPLNATHCNTPQHTATHCNTLQHTATH